MDQFLAGLAVTLRNIFDPGLDDAIESPFAGRSVYILPRRSAPSAEVAPPLFGAKAQDHLASISHYLGDTRSRRHKNGAKWLMRDGSVPRPAASSRFLYPEWRADGVMTIYKHELQRRSNGLLIQNKAWWRLCYDDELDSFFIEHEWGCVEPHDPDTAFDGGKSYHEVDGWSGPGKAKIGQAKQLLRERAGR
jgi:hypothetical protein